MIANLISKIDFLLLFPIDVKVLVYLVVADTYFEALVPWLYKIQSGNGQLSTRHRQELLLLFFLFHLEPRSSGRAEVYYAD